eukprot:UN3743
MPGAMGIGDGQFWGGPRDQRRCEEGGVLPVPRLPPEVCQGEGQAAPLGVQPRPPPFPGGLSPLLLGAVFPLVGTPLGGFARPGGLCFNFFAVFCPLESPGCWNGGSFPGSP